MFNNYILNNNVLYLEIDMKYEFGSNNNSKYKNIIEEIKFFISKANIKNKINKIIITCSGIIIGSIILFSDINNMNKENIQYVPSFKNEISIVKNDTKKVENDNKYSINEGKIEEKSVNLNKSEYKSDSDLSNNIAENNITSPGVSENETVTVYRSNNEVINIDIEEYIIGVIAAEMPASFNIEAIKAQAVVARTYALKAKKNNKILTDTVSTQSYIDLNQMKTKWGSSFDMYYGKIKNAVDDTKGEYLFYNNDYIEALYHSTNNGKTESSLDVFGNYYPYLISVSSEFDKSASSYLRSTTFDFNTISSKLNLDFNNNSQIEILSYTDGNNIKEIKINDKIFTGRQFRELLGLRSADFDIVIENETVNIITRGFGHGVGLSQYGANGMANYGYNYKDILSHYYPNTTLKK